METARPIVLCVDDEKSILSALRRVFLDEPWKVFFAESGPEGLDLIRQHGADLILSDFRMPGMNGLEFLKKVKEAHPECMRVVFSGYADIGVIIAALNEGEIYRFINKPWNDDELLDIVRKALEHQHLRKENRRLHLELELKIAQRTRELEEKNRALRFASSVLELLPAPILGIDAKKRVYFANAKARKLLDLGEDRLVGQPLPNQLRREYEAARDRIGDVGDGRVVSVALSSEPPGLIVLAAEQAVLELAQNPGDANLPRVLFVDDERAVLSSLRRVMADEPCEVRTCDNPEEALVQIREAPPAVVVADYYMPRMLGPEFLREVRGIDESIVRMILTGKPDVTAVLEAVRVGAVYRFLLKPWDEDELRMSVRRAIGYHRLVVGHNELLARLEEQLKVIANYGAESPELALLPKLELAGAVAAAGGRSS
ncbi:MAG: response regulator [Planctomycetota bacterium]|jgi:two-component system NtrC family sensor kinase